MDRLWSGIYIFTAIPKGIIVWQYTVVLLLSDYANAKSDSHSECGSELTGIRLSAPIRRASLGILRNWEQTLSVHPGSSAGGILIESGFSPRILRTQQALPDPGVSACDFADQC